jgi:hypothetical protein
VSSRLFPSIRHRGDQRVLSAQFDIRTSIELSAGAIHRYINRQVCHELIGRSVKSDVDRARLKLLELEAFHDLSDKE